MTIQGVLGDDGCADVFQLLGRQRKNGVLCLRSRMASVDLWLRGGLVLRVEDLARQDRHRLGEMLRRAGLVSQDALQEALARQRKTKRRIGEVLVEAGRLTTKDVSAFIRLQARETLFNAFFLKRGTYQFEMGRPTNPSAELDGGLKWEEVMIEVGQRLGEYPGIREVIPNNGCEVHALSPLGETGPRGDDELLLEEKTGQMGVPREEHHRPADFPDETDRAVMALVEHGVCTADDVCGRARLGEFAALRALARLAREGHVAVSTANLEDLPEAEAEELTGDDTAQRDLYGFKDLTKPEE